MNESFGFVSVLDMVFLANPGIEPTSLTRVCGNRWQYSIIDLTDALGRVEGLAREWDGRG